MKFPIFIIAVIGTALAFSEDIDINEFEYKRLYVDPLVTPEDVTPRIVNGNEAVPNSIPYQAYLIIRTADGTGWSCGGSLISPNYVLTAGHCTSGGVVASVYLGAHNLSTVESTRVLINSYTLITHEDYRLSDISNDIGLIKLPSPVALNENINVITLASLGSGSYEGKIARASGWGITQASGSATSPVLREVDSIIITNILCYSYFNIVRDTQICISGAGGVGTCSGDSGGPLVVDNEQVGLVSYGIRGCLSGYPSASTRISTYLDWIEDHSDLRLTCRLA